MARQKQASPISARRMLLIQLLAYVALAVVLYYKPNVEAWFEARQSGSSSPVTGESSGKQTSSDAAALEVETDWKSSLAPRRQTMPDEAATASEKPSTTDGSEEFPNDTMVADNPAAKVTVAKTENPASSPSKKKTESPRRKSSVEKMDRSQTKPREVPTDPENANPPPQTDRSEIDHGLGKLQEVDNNVFESSAGLIYIPGSAEGHRLKHVMQHAKDNMQKEIHGVFDGDRDHILATIDEAWMKAKKGGPDVRSEKQNGRRIYTVNLRRRIGQMGGRQGDRQGNPECRFLRLILENETEVVSAYPTKSF